LVNCQEGTNPEENSANTGKDEPNNNIYYLAAHFLIVNSIWNVMVNFISQNPADGNSLARSLALFRRKSLSNDPKQRAAKLTFLNNAITVL